MFFKGEKFGDDKPDSFFWIWFSAIEPDEGATEMVELLSTQLYIAIVHYPHHIVLNNINLAISVQQAGVTLT